MKRGVGRGAELNGKNGRAVYPPGTVSAITRYRQPPPPARTGLGLFGRIILFTLVAVSSLALAAAGGAYLYLHQTVAHLRADDPGVVEGQKHLKRVLPGHAAIALIVGYDHRAGKESGLESRSDTIMLVRADPETKTISMLSFPRDLWVEVHCPQKAGQPPPPVTHERINGAYARCGAGGTLETVKHLTGLPVNYLITVNFHGFKQIVDKLGGVWMDVDRRYYNKNVGTFETNYADIDLQPGYQRLNATQALEFVRYRHFDNDFFRLARQQAFVKAFKEQVASSFKIQQIPSLVKVVTDNVQVGSMGLNAKTVVRYAYFAATLPPGHFFQTRLQNLTSNAVYDVIAPPEEIQKAVDAFQNPDVEAPKVAHAAATGQRLRDKAPPPAQTTVTVLNGNGVAGAATNASFALSQRGYRTQEPPNGAQADAPAQEFHSKVYFDPTRAGAKPAAVALARLIPPADVAPLPRDPKLRALDPGSMVMVVLGTTFHGQLAPAPVRNVPKRQPPNVRFDRAPGLELLQPLRPRVPFRLMVPTVLERSSVADPAKPVRMYWIKRDPNHKAVRLTFRTGASEYWGVEETDWIDAPVLDDRSFRQVIGGRQFDLYYDGSHLHMVVLRANGASYWVVNTLLDSLSNETMLAIAKGLKPLTNG